jgi:glycosyltransferase involved in cell wall biosynthesis
MTPDWKPFKVAELDLGHEIKPISDLEQYTALYLLVRYHRQPLGWVWLADLSQATVTSAQLRTAIKQQLGWEFVSFVLAGRQKMVPSQGQTDTPISVVVYDPPPANRVEDSLQTLLELDYPNYEIIVVKNEPAPPGQGEALVTSDFAPTPPPPVVRTIYEEQVGVTPARNRALAEARHPLIAFIDPTARPDRNWLRAIATALADPDVMAVTGLIAPAELETPTQIRYEFDYRRSTATVWEYPGYGGSFSRELIHPEALTKSYQKKGKRKEWREWFWRGSLTPPELLLAHFFGADQNMAFRRDIFARIGLFDPSLGDSSAIEMFHRLVLEGHTLVYEPAALVWQTHPREEASLRRLVYERSRAFGAYLLTCARRGRLNRFSILKYALLEWLLKGKVWRLYRPGKLPRRLLLLELLGALASPFMVISAKQQTRQNELGFNQSSPTAEFDASTSSQAQG